MNATEPLFEHKPLRLEPHASWAIGIYLAFAAVVIASTALGTAFLVAWVLMIPIFALDQIFLVHKTTILVSLITWAVTWLLIIPFTGMPGHSTDTVNEIASWCFWGSLFCILAGHTIKWFFAAGGRSD